jgi:hypothetical protein
MNGSGGATAGSGGAMAGSGGAGGSTADAGMMMGSGGNGGVNTAQMLPPIDDYDADGPFDTTTEQNQGPGGNYTIFRPTRSAPTASSIRRSSSAPASSPRRRCTRRC